MSQYEMRAGSYEKNEPELLEIQTATEIKRNLEEAGWTAEPTLLKTNQRAGLSNKEFSQTATQGIK